MSGTENISVFVAFSAGLLSFLSPCILPLIPSYLVFITGVSLDEMSHEENLKKVRKIVIGNSLLFILGFSLVFISLGASATFLGRFLAENIHWLERIGGVIVIILGLHFAGVFKIAFLERERKFHLQEKPLGMLGTVIVGMAFGAGWTPCVGPILGAILTMAASTQSLIKGIILLAVYSIGLGLPFLLAGVLINKFFEYFQSIRKYFRIITIAGGVLLILIGVLLITGYFSSMSAMLQ
ncbi:MAG: cytochrome c biogenesis protein CcdA [Candidatus Aminicenantes bacterium]|nr:cytochrome c biogenesis protein CcdA [Candidatus Aminicenantes bacterium]OQX51670.1 MAG: cytochrome C biogenesis protein [Candidatus Aminicenantes bacterium 4484_214]RLE04281.1 MAG: cytochrome c biogenesis protein CcdA [Candidatus Aminicenantes bacterium]